MQYVVNMYGGGEVMKWSFIAVNVAYMYNYMSLFNQPFYWLIITPRDTHTQSDSQ